jgi:hypothetical protein
LSPYFNYNVIIYIYIYRFVFFFFFGENTVSTRDDHFRFGSVRFIPKKITKLNFF